MYQYYGVSNVTHTRYSILAFVYVVFWGENTLVDNFTIEPHNKP